MSYPASKSAGLILTLFAGGFAVIPFGKTWLTSLKLKSPEQAELNTRIKNNE